MNNNSNLEFRKIPSLNFLYEISEDGRIVRNVKSKHQIKIKLDMHHSKKGYYAFWSYLNLNGERKVRRHMVHSIIAECWLGPKPEGYEIDHIDRDTSNNHYSNLRYVNHSQQMKNRVLGQHIIEQAKLNCQEWNKKISVPVILLNFVEHLTFPSICETARFLSEKFNINVEHVRSKLKKRRSHIFTYDVIYLNAETAR